MKRKEALYAVIGGCVGTVLTMVVCSFLPLGAQSQGDRFGEITCTGLKVVNPDGRTMVKLGYERAGGLIGIRENTLQNLRKVLMEVGEYGGEIMCMPHYDDDIDAILNAESVRMGFIDENTRGGVVQINKRFRPLVVMGVNDQGGRLAIFGKQGGAATMHVVKHESSAKLGGYVGVFADGEGYSAMGVNQYGGSVEVGKDGVAAQIATAENGGSVNLYCKTGNVHFGGFIDPNDLVAIVSKTFDRGVGMSVDERDIGVNVYSKDGSARMRVNEYGGVLSVFGKGSKKSKAVIGVNEYGNGAVNTWDKNGFRQ